jgi:hypothetical protein
MHNDYSYEQQSNGSEDEGIELEQKPIVRGQFIPLTMEYLRGGRRPNHDTGLSAKQQAEAILQVADDAIAEMQAQGHDIKVGITYSANGYQTSTIRAVYARGDWRTGTDGANQAEVMREMEKLLQGPYRHLQGNVSILPITTMQYNGHPNWREASAQPESARSVVINNDLAAIEVFLNQGHIVLGWRNQDTRSGEYAVGGGVASTQSNAMSNDEREVACGQLRVLEELFSANLRSLPPQLINKENFQSNLVARKVSHCCRLFTKTVEELRPKGEFLELTMARNFSRRHQSGVFAGQAIGLNKNEQAKTILQVARQALENFPEGTCVGVICPVSVEQSQQIKAAYQDGNFYTGIDGERQDGVMHAMETLMRDDKLRARIRILPIATTGYTREILPDQTIPHDVAMIADFLQEGGVVLALKDQHTKSGEYAIGGRAATMPWQEQRQLFEALNDLAVRYPNKRCAHLPLSYDRTNTAFASHVSRPQLRMPG